MSNDDELPNDMRAAAAQWVARLSARPVARDTVEAFYAWRRVPAHRRAFEEASAVWDTVGSVADRPAFQEMADAALRRSRMRPRWRARVGGWTPLLAVAVVLLAVIAGLALHGLSRSTATHYATAAGERRELALADGSRVVLDADSRLAVQLSGNRRALDLAQGRAYFTVAHDPDRPFTVRAGSTQVTATGTQFAVQTLGADVAVTLVQGQVRVTDPDGEHLLEPGERLQVHGHEKVRIVRVDTGSTTAWRDGRLLLDGLTLAQAVEQVNRYARRPITLDAGDIAQEKVGGSFRQGDVDSFVTAATALLPLKAERTPDGQVHLTKMD